MKKGINLLEKSVIETKDVRELKRKNTVYSVVILIIFTLINLAAFIFTARQGKQISEYETNIQHNKSLITSFKNREAKQQVLKEKLQFLTKLDKEKTNIPSIIGFFQNAESLKVKLQDLVVSPGKITISATAENSDSLVSILTLLIENESGRALFSNVKLNGLSLLKGGKYQFDISLTPTS